MNEYMHLHSVLKFFHMWFSLSHILEVIFCLFPYYKKIFLSLSLSILVCVWYVLRTTINIFIPASCEFLLTSKEVVLHVEDISNYIEESGNHLPNSNKC